MRFPIYTVDAFTTQRFKGNPAAVLLSTKEIAVTRMQEIAAEFNLSETAFPTPINAEESFESARVFNLRYFSPKVEVDLCGHATLATAHVLFNEIGNPHSELEFHTKGGVVASVRKHEKGLEINFPARTVVCAHLDGTENARAELFNKFDSPSFLVALIRSVVPKEVAIRSVSLAAADRYLIVEIDSSLTKDQFLSIDPDTVSVLRLHPSGDLVLGVIVTFAPKDAARQGFVDEEGVPYDYVSRFFAPWMGVKEDPATGSSQCSLGPYWSAILGKKQLYAFQCFPNRGAQFAVTVGEGAQEGRVAIVGASLTVVRGVMEM